MVIHNFHVERMGFAPNKANAVLPVDPDAVLAFPVPSRRFQVMSRNDRQILKDFSRI